MTATLERQPLLLSNDRRGYLESVDEERDEEQVAPHNHQLRLFLSLLKESIPGEYPLVHALSLSLMIGSDFIVHSSELYSDSMRPSDGTPGSGRTFGKSSS
jgi:hypothetical protein